MAIDYWWTTTVEGRAIRVARGSPTTAKYAVFYAEEDDPVIFCKTMFQVVNHMKRLRAKKSVKTGSIRVFRLVPVREGR